MTVEVAYWSIVWYEFVDIDDSNQRKEPVFPSITTYHMYIQYNT